MRDIVQTTSGKTWRLIEDAAEAKNVGDLSAMPGVPVFFDGDRKTGKTNAYYALFTKDSTKVDVVARVDGPVCSYGFHSPHPEFSEDIQGLEAAIGRQLEPVSEAEPSVSAGPGGP
jgi:hypothetical protein